MKQVVPFAFPLRGSAPRSACPLVTPGAPGSCPSAPAAHGQLLVYALPSQIYLLRTYGQSILIAAIQTGRSISFSYPFYR